MKITKAWGIKRFKVNNIPALFTFHSASLIVPQPPPAAPSGHFSLRSAFPSFAFGLRNHLRSYGPRCPRSPFLSLARNPSFTSPVLLSCRSFPRYSRVLPSWTSPARWNRKGRGNDERKVPFGSFTRLCLTHSPHYAPQARFGRGTGPPGEPNRSGCAAMSGEKRP